MNKKILVLLLMLTTILIIGCTSKKPVTPISDINVYQGTNGLEVNFLPNSQAQEIYENETFQVVTQIKNKGAYPIQNGKIVINYPKDDFTGGPASYDFQLKGKEVYDPSDHETVKTFNLKAIPLLKLSKVLETEIMLTACYDYSTRLNTQVCIDTDPHKIKPIEKPCEVKTLSFSGQGSPVTVTKVEQKILANDKGVRPQFKIYIRNAGKGQVFSKNKIMDACSSGKLSREDINGVTLKDIRFSDYTMDSMECLPKTLRLIEGEDYFICTLKEEYTVPSAQSTFLTNFYVEFEYGYMSTNSKQIKIKKITTT